MADSILIKTGPDCYPLSPMQQGMLFHNLYAQHPGVDVEQVLVELREDMKPAAFERAWQHVAERHEILRTGFHWQGTGRPYQEVQRHVHIHLDQVDWRDVPARKRGDALESILRVERCRGFNLTVPPLVRLTLIRLGQARYQFIFTFHHLLLDARSIALLLREVFDVYDAFRQEREPRSPFSRPYRDYIDWLQKQDLSKAEAFWRETLKGFTTPTSLNVAGAALETGELKEPRAEQEITLDERVTASLQAFAAENKFTLNTMLQGAWALLLSRYRDEEDVAFGAVRACRRSSIEGADSIVGLFINTVPMRVRVVPDMTVVAWLQQLRSQWIALRDYEHTPLASIQSWSEVADGQPLFESLLNFQDPGWEASLRALGGKWSGRQFGIRSQPNYPLALDASAGPGLLIKILYDRHRFDDSAIQRMLGHLKTLLEGLAAQPHQPLCSLPLLTTAERHQLLETWNATSAELPADKCVHELFEEQARRTPDALAVADEALQLTYRELNTQADAVASRLHGLGVGPDALVGVCIPRSVEMVVALLGVLKAGGAYVPLDPTYPPERLALVLEDSRAPVLLTTKTLRSQFESRVSNVNVVCVDEAPPASTTSLCTPVPHTRNLAYVIYTSGSTGTPKGVAIEHRSLVNLIAWHQREYAVKASDRATQVASPAFDASVWEIWPYLTAGASIHIPDEETRVSPGKLLPWLAGKRITLSFIPTPLAEAMLNEPWPEGCALRALLTGGDKLHRCPGEQFACPLINHYGPTENTVVTTSAAVPRGVSNATAMPPIGRPSSNTQVYVLDRHLQLAPIGVAGELHIGGAGLARGYLNRPGLTAEKFIRNPFNGDPDSRLYKTGDLVRWLPDGNLEFLGRIDHQVKVRGNRIELGEIESVLGRHPAVRQSIVLLRGDGRDDKRLLAWVVPALEQLPTSENLREFLRQKLPDYMLPAAFVFLDTLPLTPNGKVDRAALQSPELDTKSESAFARPRTSTEEMLAGIWWAVLGVKQIGVHDNFFALGGHSLLAAQVISRVRNAFQVELPLRDLFDAPTVAGLAQRIDAAVRGAQGLHCQPLTPLAGNAGWPVAFAQERLWFFEQLEPGKPFNNIPVAVRLTGALNLEALEHSLGEIVRRHAALRTTFTNHQGRPKAVPNPPQPLALNVTDLTSLSPDEREAAAKQLTCEEARKPFDLTQSPLLRARLLRLGADEHQLLITTHHIACDGWSMGIFYRELAVLYEAFVQGQPSALPELPVSYGDFAGWQREWLRGEALENQIAFWKQQLSGPLPVLDLPTDRPRPALQTYRGATKHFALPTTLTSALLALSRQQDVTLFMLLLAAFQTLLHRCTGQEDIIVGTPIAGRTRVETEGLIGFFLNTLARRGDLSGDPAFSSLLKRTRRAALDAYPHEDLPFEKLVDALQLERDLSRSPLFQVMFILQNEPLRPLELPGLKLTPLPVHSGTSKFDCTLSLEQSGGTLAGYVEYNTDLFEAATIERMVGHFQTLLEGIVTNPEARLSALPLLTGADRKQLLVDWNETRTDFPKDKCVHELFEDQVGRTPDKVAVVFDDAELTYRELNDRANRLADELRSLGVGPEVRVGLCVERSFDMMVSLLGILKAGGCYVPLDPTYPAERLAFMLEDSQATVLLTQESLRDGFNFEILNLRVVCLDAAHDASRVLQRSAKPQSDNLAYVLYTSGSTGKPKGVMVTHRNVVNFFTGMDRVLGTKPGVWLAVTSISFDISVLELFWTLARGFKVIIQPNEEWSRPAESRAHDKSKNGQWRSVPEQILRHDVTHMQCTPSLAGALTLAPASLEATRRLSKLLLGGEALPVSLAAKLRQTLRGDLLNMYGPTETTVWSATHRVGETGGVIPIGRPIANTEMYILDQHLQPTPAGVPGELFIGGEGVARGYLNRPELTAERFIRHPFSTDSGARLYRTGDRARYGADGTIEFMGRFDHQIKLRGHRIELGEIESVLRRHSLVRECVALVREDVPGDQRLVAYVVASTSEPAAGQALHSFLAGKLPDYMVPSAFMFLDALPLTPNKKVDRKALPKPDGPCTNFDTAFVSPRTSKEKVIAGIWRELLQVQRVGLHDNFFDLGGHSLLVVQAQSRLRDALGVEVPVVKLFQYPTVRTLAQFVGGELKEHDGFDKIHARVRRQKAVFARGRELQAATP